MLEKTPWTLSEPERMNRKKLIRQRLREQLGSGEDLKSIRMRDATIFRVCFGLEVSTNVVERHRIKAAG
jgi:hypothetical protein